MARTMGNGFFSALALVAVAGCQSAPQPPVQSIQERVTLQPMQSCSALEHYIQDTAVTEMRGRMESWKQGAGWWGLGLASDAAPMASKSSSGPAAYTTTNVQVKGVDEPDFVKNDGTRIFALAGGKLYATTSWPPQDLALASSLAIEGYPIEMFLDEKNRVIVMSYIYAQATQNDASRCFSEYCWYGASATKLTVVDVQQMAAPRVIDELYLPGGYSNARRIGSSVRLVLSDYLAWPTNLKWFPDWDPANPNGWSDPKWRAREADKLIAYNEPILRAQPLAAWLPPAKRKLGDGTQVDLGYSCSDFYVSSAPAHLGLVTIATINLDKTGAAPGRTTILAEPGTVYASAKSLYVGSMHWWWGWGWTLGQTDHTYIHKFDITDPDRARYVASGGVDGHFWSQLALDENAAGFLRVASTITSRVTDAQHPENVWGRLQTSSDVSVLAEASGVLARVGHTGELAVNEGIYGSRFVDDKGYIVTFRQVDPLFTIDLSDATRPRVVGSLKVPGVSTYLHPLDANHLLTMGIYMPEPDASGHTDWTKRRMQLSLFDVSDFAHPVEKFTQTVGTAYGWSEAAWDMKAFNYFPERKLLAIPFSDYQQNQSGQTFWDSFTSEVRVFSVDAQSGFSARGAISMKDVYQEVWRGGYDWRYSPWIRRSVMASDDAGNDFVYALSDAGIRVASGKALDAPIATVPFSGK